MSNHSLVCWTEIPVTDMNKGIEFYKAVFGYSFGLDETGPNPMAMFGDDNDGVRGHLYPGKPAIDGSGPTIHLTVADTVEAASKRCTDAGGTVLSPAIDIPPGRFAYATDPDGNSLGLFQPTP